MSANAFNLGVLGMMAQSEKMVVIGNNIANVTTTSFKAGAANFAELFVTHQGQLVNGVHNQFGNGVQIAGITSDWSPGSLQDTSTESNVAIEGNGFFGVKYPDQDELLYTRAGDFALTEAPSTINSGNGYALMRPNGVILCGAHESELQADGTFSTQMKPLYFYAQKWDATGGGGAGAWREWNTDPVSAGGDGPTPSPTSFLVSSEGIVSAQPSGPTTGNEVDGDVRSVMRIEGDTTSFTQVRVPIQRFNNPDSLSRLESGMFSATDKTSPLNSDADGAPKASAANSNGCGRTRQGMLEQSNVDLVNEFTEMIVTQRAFQANSKTITTADEMQQVVMNLKR